MTLNQMKRSCTLVMLGPICSRRSVNTHMLSVVSISYHIKAGCGNNIPKPPNISLVLCYFIYLLQINCSSNEIFSNIIPISNMPKHVSIWCSQHFQLNLHRASIYFYLSIVLRINPVPSPQSISLYFHIICPYGWCHTPMAKARPPFPKNSAPTPKHCFHTLHLHPAFHTLILHPSLHCGTQCTHNMSIRSY